MESCPYVLSYAYHLDGKAKHRTPGLCLRGDDECCVSFSMHMHMHMHRRGWGHDGSRSMWTMFIRVVTALPGSLRAGKKVKRNWPRLPLSVATQSESRSTAEHVQAFEHATTRALKHLGASKGCLPSTHFFEAEEGQSLKRTAQAGDAWNIRPMAE